MAYFDQILHTYACHYSVSTGVHTHLFMDKGLLSIGPVCHGQLVKILITLEPYKIFRSNFAYLFLLILSSHWYAKRCQGFAEDHFGYSVRLSVCPLAVNEMFITFEPHGLFDQMLHAYAC